MDDNIARLENCHNVHQGRFKKVLCVCSAGLLRSATAAVVLSQEPYNFNTRTAGLHEYALVPVDEVLIEWADEIVTMEMSHMRELRDRFEIGKKVVHVLGIPDRFAYRDPELMALIGHQYDSCVIRGANGC